MDAGQYDEAFDAFYELNDYKDSVEKRIECENAAKEVAYNHALELMNNGKYEEAISAFEALVGYNYSYKNSSDKIVECEQAIAYNEALELMNAEKYEEAISAFEELNGFKDSAAKIDECNTAILDSKYSEAVKLMDAGNYEEAVSAFKSLDGYKDSSAKIYACNIKKIKIADVGDIVYFGSYEQDNDPSNGKEEIEWLVIAKKENEALVISKYALDRQPYNTSYTDVTWETCSLRRWLNGAFISAAFSSEEQKNIKNTTVTADKNPYYGTNPGNATNDKVFLLSVTESVKYFSSDSARKCSCTEYVNALKTPDSWWLRSPGDDQYCCAAYVSYDGSLDFDGSGHWAQFNYLDEGLAVRPALWIGFE